MLKISAKPGMTSEARCDIADIFRIFSLLLLVLVILGIVAASTLSIIPLSYSGFSELFLSFSAAVAGGLLAMLLGRLEEKSDV